MSKRKYQYPLMEWIEKRWSPRAFSTKPVPEDEIRAVIDAARQAPSCFNEQPWRFMVAHTPEQLEIFRDLLMEKNRLWAGQAPVLILILTAQNFSANGKPNRYSAFDAGTAWGFLSLEAQRRGLCTHAMAGYKRLKAREVLNIPEEYELMAMVAMGYYGDPEVLDAAFKELEEPNERKPLDEIVLDPNQWQ